VPEIGCTEVDLAGAGVLEPETARCCRAKRDHPSARPTGVEPRPERRPEKPDRDRATAPGRL